LEQGPEDGKKWSRHTARIDLGSSGALAFLLEKNGITANSRKDGDCQLGKGNNSAEKKEVDLSHGLNGAS